MAYSEAVFLHFFQKILNVSNQNENKSIFCLAAHLHPVASLLTTNPSNLYELTTSKAGMFSFKWLNSPNEINIVLPFKTYKSQKKNNLFCLQYFLVSWLHRKYLQQCINLITIITVYITINVNNATFIIMLDFHISPNLFI